MASIIKNYFGKGEVQKKNEYERKTKGRSMENDVNFISWASDYTFKSKLQPMCLKFKKKNCLFVNVYCWLWLKPNSFHSLPFHIKLVYFKCLSFYFDTQTFSIPLARYIPVVYIKWYKHYKHELNSPFYSYSIHTKVYLCAIRQQSDKNELSGWCDNVCHHIKLLYQLSG